MSSPRSPFYELEFPPAEPRRPSPDVWKRPPGPEEPEDPRPTRLRVHVILFVATVVSVFFTQALLNHPPGAPPLTFFDVLQSWVFAVPFLAILIVHEFGHYIAARIHGVEASLPFFIPLPIVSLLGTMGAVIAMRGRIRSRNALLDIGASGPLAGLVVALPVLAIGLSLSHVGPNPASNYTQEGQSLLYLAMKRVVLGPIPDGYDVQLHPTALAGWAGLLITMMNLVPYSQLDGGHVAYAVLGPRQNRYARIMRACLIPVFLYNAVTLVAPVIAGWPAPLGAAVRDSAFWAAFAQAFSNSLFWLVWYAVLGVIARFSGSADHPPTEPGELSPARRVIAWITLAFFVLLFMPIPLAQH